MKTLLIVLYLLAGFTISALTFINDKRMCISASPGIYVLITAAWPLAGLFFVANTLSGELDGFRPNNCRKES